MAVTLKTTVSRKVRKELGDPKPHQLFLGHYGVFGVIGLLQSTFSLGGSLLFLHVQAVHPLLFMLSGWVSSLVFSFFTYTLVASFGNVGKAIGVLFLVMQISGANGAYPLAVLPKIISGISRSCLRRIQSQQCARRSAESTVTITGLRLARYCCSFRRCC